MKKLPFKVNDTVLVRFAADYVSFTAKVVRVIPPGVKPGLEDAMRYTGLRVTDPRISNVCKEKKITRIVLQREDSQKFIMLPASKVFLRYMTRLAAL